MHTQSMPHLLGPHNPKNTTFLTLKKKKKKNFVHRITFNL